MGLRTWYRSVHSLVQTVNYWRMASGAALGSARTNLSSRESRVASSSVHAKAVWAPRLEADDSRRFSTSSTRRYKSDTGAPPSTAKVTGLPSYVKVVEVGPRDGLQNEKEIVPTSVKVQIIQRLVAAGLPVVEATSLSGCLRCKGCDGCRPEFGTKPMTCFGTKLEGLEGSNGGRDTEVAILAAASESFAKANTNCSIEESINRFREVCDAAKEQDTPVRGYVSCVVGCPIDGPISPDNVALQESSTVWGATKSHWVTQLGSATPER